MWGSCFCPRTWTRRWWSSGCCPIRPPCPMTRTRSWMCSRATWSDSSEDGPGGDGLDRFSRLKTRYRRKSFSAVGHTISARPTGGGSAVRPSCNLAVARLGGQR